MVRTHYTLTILVLVASCAMVTARELRTPLPFHLFDKIMTSNGTTTSFIDFDMFDDLQLYTVANSQWLFNMYSSGYGRHTDSAYMYSDGKKRAAPLAQLIFGSAAFPVAQTFSTASVTESPTAILRSILQPRISYHDAGLLAGVDVCYQYNSCWSVGLRAHMPLFRRVTVQKKISPGIGSGSFGDATINDLFLTQSQPVAGTPVTTFATRMDLVASLPTNISGPGTTIPLMNFANPVQGNNITIANVNLTERTTLTTINVPEPITVIARPDGSAPSTFAIPFAQAAQLPILSDDDTAPLGTNNRARFSASQNYTPLGNSPAIQEQLWLVPTITPAGMVANNAMIVRDAIESLLTTQVPSASQLFTTCGISLDSQTNQGVGDLDTYMYVHYQPNSYAVIEGLFGIRWPTGKKVTKDAPFLWPLGNNGHFEVAVGLKKYRELCDFAAIQADITYNKVFRHHEQLPASFATATIKNLGPIINGTVAWQYCTAHCDLFMHTSSWWQEHNVELNLGYEWYHKWRDAIQFAAKTSVDCLGNTSLLSSNLLEKYTKVTAHKLYIHGMYTYTVDDQWQLTGHIGGSFVVHGINIPKEHEWVVGIDITV